MRKDNIKTLKEAVSLLPPEPGVYRFLNSEDKVIYVGKAKNLKKRVSSYFVARENQGAKLRVLVRSTERIEHTVVASEDDALLLENNLIKELQPRYNMMLKDDKTYPWICIRNERFPRIVSTRRHERDGSRYFGPYSSVYAQKQVLELIRAVHTLRTCSLNLTPENINKGKFNVCLEYHIGNCKGPCVGYQDEEDYNRNIDLAADVLKGEIRAVIEHLSSEMSKAAGEMKFELAQKFKHKIELVSNFHIKSVVVSNSIGNLDVLSLITEGGSAYCNFMRIKDGAIVNTFTSELKLPIEEAPEDILSFAISAIGDKIDGGLAREIVVPFIPGREAPEGSRYVVPQRGDKLKLLELSLRNCRLYRLEKLKYIEKTDPKRHTERIMEAMRKDLYLAEAPRHIECFDNSNIQGSNPVASCVVFRDGKPSKKEYRHFNIKSVVGANDFASMEEVVRRRYERLIAEGAELPQLIVIDGGKGQLRFAHDILKSLGLTDRVAVVGLAKRLEELFFPDDPTPHYLDKNSETLKVLMHIRDEAHRFGVSFHRQKRSLDFIKSELELIPGIGAGSIEKLLKKFRSVSGIKSASADELAGVVGKVRAKAIIDFFTAEDKTVKKS